MPSPYGDWNGHVFYLNRKKNLIFVNNKSYYTILIPEVTKRDLGKFQELFLNRLCEQLVFDKVVDSSDTLILLQKNLPVVLTTTNNDQVTLGLLREQIHNFSFTVDSPFHIGQSLTRRNHYLNGVPTEAGSKTGKYSFPIDNMKEIYKDLRK